MSDANPNEIVHGPITSEGILGRKCIRRYHNGESDTYTIRGLYVKTVGFDDQPMIIVENLETSTLTHFWAHQVKLLPIREMGHE